MDTPEKPWPGTADGSCPECGVIRDGWDMEYHVAHIGGGLGLILVDPPDGKLIALTCPACKTKFKVADLSEGKK